MMPNLNVNQMQSNKANALNMHSHIADYSPRRFSDNTFVNSQLPYNLAVPKSPLVSRSAPTTPGNYNFNSGSGGAKSINNINNFNGSFNQYRSPTQRSFQDDPFQSFGLPNANNANSSPLTSFYKRPAYSRSSPNTPLGRTSLNFGSPLPSASPNSLDALQQQIDALQQSLHPESAPVSSPTVKLMTNKRV